MIEFSLLGSNSLPRNCLDLVASKFWILDMLKTNQYILSDENLSASESDPMDS